MKHYNFCCGHVHQYQNSTNQISVKSLQAFLRYETSKIGLVSSFFPLLFPHLFAHLQKLHMHEFNCLEIWHTEGGIKMHPGTKIGWNTISSQGVISNSS